MPIFAYPCFGTCNAIVIYFTRKKEDKKIYIYIYLFIVGAKCWKGRIPIYIN